MVVSSTDGYCTIIVFEEDELGLPYKEQLKKESSLEETQEKEVSMDTTEDKQQDLDKEQVIILYVTCDIYVLVLV